MTTPTGPGAPARDEGVAGAGTSASGARAESSPWAPLRQRAFRWLWLGVLISAIGTWMQTVGAQWLLVDAPNAAVLVSLVQAATTLPVMLLALPGGVLADSFDRRWLLFTVQVYFFVVGILLAVLTAAGPDAAGAAAGLHVRLRRRRGGAAADLGAMIPELVPRTQLRAASRLDLVNVNVARAVGPALAGLVIAHLGGVPVVFALNAASRRLARGRAAALARRPQADVGSRPGAVRAGAARRGRYVWHEPVVRRILLRAVLFVAPAMALWALLPLIASQRLGLGADGYGALFGASGVGAIVGALVLRRCGTGLSTNGILGAGGAVCRGAGCARAGPQLPGGPGHPGAGRAGLDGRDVDACRPSCSSSCPAWVRARGLAMYTVTFMGSHDRRCAALGTGRRTVSACSRRFCSRPP